MRRRSNPGRSGLWLAAVALTALPGFAQAPAPPPTATGAAPSAASVSQLAPCPVPSAAVRVEMFSDPQCGACRRFYVENLHPLLEEFAADGSVCIHHNLYPLSFHEHAREASLLAAAAGSPGASGRERVLDVLYRTQHRWGRDGDLDAVLAETLTAEELAGLRRRAAAPEIAEIVDGEKSRGRELDVRGTPTIFVITDGERQRIPSTVQYPIFRRYVASLVEP